MELKFAENMSDESESKAASEEEIKEKDKSEGRRTPVLSDHSKASRALEETRKQIEQEFEDEEAKLHTKTSNYERQSNANSAEK